MAIVTIQAPNGGSFQIDAPEGATDDQIFRFAKSQGLFEQQVPEAPTQDNEPSFTDSAIGVAENIGSLVSGVVAEPIAGIAGIAQSVNPFADEGAGAEAVQSTRDALTYKPSTEAGMGQQQAIGETLAPVGEALSSAESFLGDNVLELTGSPALASVAHTLPTAALELIGLKGSKRLTGAAKAPTKKQIKKAIVESAPEVDQIKNASRAIYKEIDDSGVTIKPDAINKLVSSLEQKTRAKGLDPRVTQKAAGAMDVIRDSKGSAQAIGELDTLRNVAQNVAGSLDAQEKMLGQMMISEIDDFLDNLTSKDLISGNADTGKKFKTARKLWGRARRSELISDAIKAGEGRASGAENGIRIELDKIVRNKKLSKFFPEAEKNLIKDVVKGDFAQNMAKLVGRFGFSEGRATNVLSAMSGVGAGGVLAGGAGAFLVPAVGTVSRQIAQKLTRNKAKFTNSMVRAGNDANKIAKAYLTAVPKAKRSVKDLSDLLSDPKVNLDDLEMIANQTAQDALAVAKGKRAINLATAALAGTAKPEETINQN